MNCHDCRPLLGAYIDDPAGTDERVAVAAHLRTCAPCSALMEDLSAIRDAAGSLEPLVPPARVWHQLSAAAALEPRRAQVRWFNWRPLAAAVTAVLIAGGLWRMGTLLHPVSTGAPPPQIADGAAGAGADADAHYTVAIASLEEVTSANRGVLDEQTAGAITAGMTVIDDAIVESRAALRSEPQSESARRSLSMALRRKVALLQDMVTLINEMGTGDRDTGDRVLSEIQQ